MLKIFIKFVVIVLHIHNTATVSPLIKRTQLFHLVHLEKMVHLFSHTIPFKIMLHV